MGLMNVNNDIIPFVEKDCTYTLDDNCVHYTKLTSVTMAQVTYVTSFALIVPFSFFFPIPLT
jgi:hypothetical protein